MLKMLFGDVSQMKRSKLANLIVDLLCETDQCRFDSYYFLAIQAINPRLAKKIVRIIKEDDLL